MRIAALDLSKRSAGFAAWSPEDSTVASGCWALGSEFSSNGRTFANLHARLSELNSLGKIDALYWERPLNLGPSAGNTNIDTIEVLMGLAAHAESWGEAMGCRIVKAVNMVTWRREFLGRMKRGTRSTQLKEMSMERCRQLGFKPMKHDQAEAIGILDWACTELDIIPYWRLPLGRAA